MKIVGRLVYEPVKAGMNIQAKRSVHGVSLCSGNRSKHDLHRTGTKKGRGEEASPTPLLGGGTFASGIAV